MDIRMNNTDILVAEDDVRKRVECKLVNGVCSDLLISQLAVHMLNGYEKYGNEFHHYHAPSILDIIGANELAFTVNTREFRNLPLKGLKHIHHNSSTFVATNVKNHWLSKLKGKDEVTFQNELLKETYDNLLKVLTPDEAEKTAFSVMLSKVHNEATFKSTKKRTGEWLITYSGDKKTYYLCLATHREANDFGDEVIWERVKKCFNQFPELENCLSVD